LDLKQFQLAITNTVKTAEIGDVSGANDCDNVGMLPLSPRAASAVKAYPEHSAVPASAAAATAKSSLIQNRRPFRRDRDRRG
jgi:hypothetical protein